MQPELNVHSSYENSPVRKYKVNNYTDERFTASQDRFAASQDRGSASETDYQSNKKGSQYYYSKDNIAAKSLKVSAGKNLLAKEKQESD